MFPQIETTVVTRERVEQVQQWLQQIRNDIDDLENSFCMLPESHGFFDEDRQSYEQGILDMGRKFESLRHSQELCTNHLNWAIQIMNEGGEGVAP